MTWPASIAAVLGVIAAAMIYASQHGLAPRNNTQHQDGEQP
ncbi:hypothetical protein [Streptomyces sp. AcH 505]